MWGLVGLVGLVGLLGLVEGLKEGIDGWSWSMAFSFGCGDEGLGNYSETNS